MEKRISNALASFSWQILIHKDRMSLFFSSNQFGLKNEIRENNSNPTQKVRSRRKQISHHIVIVS